MLLLLVPGVGMGAGGGEAPPPVVSTEPIRPSGGWPADQGYRRGRKEVSEARKRLGLDDGYKVSTIIADVAVRQVERLEQDQQKIFDELLRELELQGLEFDARYLESLAIQRQSLIDAEIATRIQQGIRDDEELMILILMAGAAIR